MYEVTSVHETFVSHNVHTDGYRYWAIFQTEPFADGVCCYAFNGKYCGWGPLNGTNCVAKVFKKKYAKNSLVNWVGDLAVSEKAQMFAQYFNTTVLYNLDISPKRRLNFVIPLIAKVEQLARFELPFRTDFPPLEDERYVMRQDYVALEPFIHGEYVKFNTNGGYENQVISQLMPAFTHWTWEISGHKYMVCDLQGVKYQYDYKLTDPVVHSVEKLFGPTDLGVVGMEKVLANHECNFICHQLCLQNPMKNVPIPAESRSTTYSFQLKEEEKMRRQRGFSRFFQVMPAILE